MKANKKGFIIVIVALMLALAILSLNSMLLATSVQTSATRKATGLFTTYNLDSIVTVAMREIKSSFKTQQVTLTRTPLHTISVYTTLFDTLRYHNINGIGEYIRMTPTELIQTGMPSDIESADFMATLTANPAFRMEIKIENLFMPDYDYYANRMQFLDTDRILLKPFQITLSAGLPGNKLKRTYEFRSVFAKVEVTDKQFRLYLDFEESVLQEVLNEC